MIGVRRSSRQAKWLTFMWDAEENPVAAGESFVLTGLSGEEQVIPQNVYLIRYWIESEIPLESPDGAGVAQVAFGNDSEGPEGFYNLGGGAFDSERFTDLVGVHGAGDTSDNSAFRSTQEDGCHIVVNVTDGDVTGGRCYLHVEMRPSALH